MRGELIDRYFKGCSSSGGSEAYYRCEENIEKSFEEYEEALRKVERFSPHLDNKVNTFNLRDKMLEAKKEQLRKYDYIFRWPAFTSDQDALDFREQFKAGLEPILK